MFESIGMSTFAIVLVVIGMLIYAKLKKWLVLALFCTIALVVSTGGNAEVLHNNIESITKRHEAIMQSKDSQIASLQKEIDNLMDNHKKYISQYYIRLVDLNIFAMKHSGRR